MRTALPRRQFVQAAGLAGVAGVGGVAGGAETDARADGDGRREILAPDVGGLSYWEYAMFCCLQGLANRDEPRVIHYYPEKSEESWYEEHPVPDTRVFYEWHKSYGTTEFVEFDDPYELFDRLDPLPFEGYVVVDKAAPATVNVAANYASTEDLLPVTADLLARDELPDREVVYDLRDEHEGANFAAMSRVEVYEWAYEHQWPDANHARLANLSTPDRDNEPPIDISSYTDGNDTIYLRFADADPTDGGGTQLHEVRVVRDGEVVTEIIPTTDAEQDHLVEEEGTSTGDARQIRWTGFDGYWIYEIDGVEGADELELVVRNQWHVSVATSQAGEYDLLTESLETDFGEPVTKFGRFEPEANFFFTSNRSRDFTVAEGGFFVELASDGSAEHDLKSRILDEMDEMGTVFGWHTQRASEGQHISHLSQHGVLSIGASTYAANFSFYSRFDPPGDAVKRFRNRARQPPTTDNVDDKVYLTFHLSDGDSLNFLMRRAQGGQWLLDERGDIEMGWEMAPLLADLGPGILDYFQATATETDHFVGGPSGVAYFYPQAMDEDDLRTVLDATKRAFERVGLTATTVMRSGPDTPDLYEEHVGEQLTGVMDGYVQRRSQTRLFGEHDLGPDGEGRLPIDSRQATAYLPTALPVGHHARGSVEDLLGPLERLVERRRTQPLFVPVHITAHSLTIADMVELMNRLDEQYPDTFEAVGPDAFFTLWAEARAGSVVFEPPESSAPSDVVLVDDVTNRLTPTLQAYGEEPVAVDVDATLSIDGDEFAVGGGSGTIDGGTTAELPTDVDVPDVQADEGTLEFTIDDGRPGTVAVPAQVIQWPAGVDRPDIVRDPSVYEAEAANHNVGSRVEEADALNGVAWRATYDPGSHQDDHMVWYPTTEQNEPGEYVALFRCKVANNDVGGETVATLDVVENVPFGDPAFFIPEEVGPSLDVSERDFDASDEYRWFALAFEKPINEDKADEIDNYFDRSQTQYRVEYRGHTAVTVDRIFVVRTG